MKTFILAGGLGTRLRSVVDDRPKPMAPIKSAIKSNGSEGVPFLSYQLAEMKEQGFDEFILCVSYMYESIMEYYQDGEQWELSIKYSIESEPLGTAGALLHAEEHIDSEPFLVLNGDSFIQADFQSMMAHHYSMRKSEPSIIGTILTTHIENTNGYGVLGIGPCGLVDGFYEKGLWGPGWINAGAYVLDPSILSFIPRGKVSIEHETFPRVISSGYRLCSFGTGERLIDIGTPSGYECFNRLAREHDLAQIEYRIQAGQALRRSP